MRAEKIRRAVKKFNNAYFMFMVMRDACGFFVANSHFPGATTMWRTGRRDKMAQKKKCGLRNHFDANVLFPHGACGKGNCGCNGLEAVMRCYFWVEK